MAPSDSQTHHQPDVGDAALHSGMTQIATLPVGSVTFLYTDIEGSTERWERNPTAMRAALVRHHAILRTTIEAHGGVVYQIIGDAFVAVFAQAVAALAAALAAQRAVFAEAWGAELAPLRVRMGLHHGQGRYGADGYHAEESLNRLFRMLSASYGGQIVLTDAVHTLIDEWPSAVVARDLGLHGLRDLTTKVRVWQITVPDLPAEFPPLRSLEHHPNNLPSQTTELYGRAGEIATVAARLRGPHTRQLTLTGLGGIGKTRLALAVATELLPTFPDGVYVVALDHVQNAAQIAPTLATTLGIRESSEQPLHEILAQWLQSKRLLLVVDNCEHVLAAMPLVADLLRAAPRLHVLATSRVPLGVYGEQEHAVPPLPLPEKATDDLSVFAQNAAIQLFVARAQAVTPSFALNVANAATIAAICVRLEGLPLAIELAAARVRALPPAQILARLADRLDFLAAHSRDGPSRQHTLRATLEWSYELLTPAEQQLLAQLSVFIGGASLEAVTAVWSGGAQELDVVDGLIGLISHSLVQPPLGNDTPRYRLLELVREYGGEQLSASGATAAVTLRHATYFQQFAATHGPNVKNNRVALAAIAQDYPNLRAGLGEALRRHDSTLALNIGEHLLSFWHSSGNVREGWELIQEVLALPLPHHAARELRIQHTQVQQRAVMLGEELGHKQAYALAKAALSTARTLGDDLLLARCLNRTIDFLDPLTDYDQCKAALNEALMLYERVDWRIGVDLVYNNLGITEAKRGSFAAAQAYFAIVLTRSREDGHKQAIEGALNNLAGVLIAQQQYAEAEGYLTEALAINYELDDQQTILRNLVNLSDLALRQADVNAARAYLRDGLQLADKGNYTVLAIFLVGNVGRLAQLQEDVEQATRLLSAHEALTGAQQRMGSTLSEHEQAALHAAQAQARAQLGEQAFAAHDAVGQTMTLAEAITAAWAVIGESPQ